MKRLLSIISLSLLAAFSIAQQVSLVPVPDSIYYERLYYLCKAWGVARYHHTGIAAGNINWDDELFNAIHGAKYAPIDEGFNDSLQMILDNIFTDYEVHPTIAGIRAGIDELMAFALDCALLDVEDIEYTDDVSVYPNPFVDHLIYEIQGNGNDYSFQLEIFDLY